MHDTDLLPKYEFKSDEERKMFEPLIAMEGSRVSLRKVSMKRDDTFIDIRPEHKGTGTLTLYNRGGGPAFYVGSIQEWFASSWIKSVKKIPSNNTVEVETENNIYELR